MDASRMIDESISLGTGETSLKALWLKCGGSEDTFLVLKVRAIRFTHRQEPHNLRQAQVCAIACAMLIRGYDTGYIASGTVKDLEVKMNA